MLSIKMTTGRQRGVSFELINGNRQARRCLASTTKPPPMLCMNRREFGALSLLWSIYGCFFVKMIIVVFVVLFLIHRVLANKELFLLFGLGLRRIWKSPQSGCSCWPFELFCRAIVWWAVSALYFPVLVVSQRGGSSRVCCIVESKVALGRRVDRSCVSTEGFEKVQTYSEATRFQAPQ